MTETGDNLKKDYGKVTWHLMPMKAVAEIVKVLMFGAKKYAPEGWKELIHDRGRVENALMRHIIAHKEGEVLDKETGLPHMAHAGCNIIFLLWFWLEDQKKIIPNACLSEGSYRWNPSGYYEQFTDNQWVKYTLTNESRYPNQGYGEHQRW